MTEDKQLIDSNVLVYAYDRSSVKHTVSVEIMKKCMKEDLGVLSVQNLVEFARVVTEKLPNKITYEQARNIITELSDGFEIICYDQHTLADALSISSSYRIHFLDALLAATMEKENIEMIITENEKDFKKIPWLKVKNPFEQL